MFNDEGLGEAMAQSYERDRAKQLEARVAALERRLQTLQEAVQLAFSAQAAAVVDPNSVLRQILRG